MDLYEWIGFIAVGFVPTLVGLEITWRIDIRRLSSSIMTNLGAVTDERKAAITIKGVSS
jgi:hypothetical protein